MDTLWQLWQTVVTWAGMVWAWLLMAWGWIIFLPWSEWWNVIWLAVISINTPNISIHAPNMTPFITTMFNANSIDVLSNVATILATLWLIVNGREYFYQSRLDRLQELYVRIEELNRGFMSVNEGRDVDLYVLRTTMKNQFYNYQFILARDPDQRRELKELIERVDDDAQQYKTRKNNKNIKELRQFVSILIDVRPWYSRIIYFLFVKMWRDLWRWFRRLFVPKIAS